MQYLLCGLPAIDVEDWKKNTEYFSYKSTDDTIMWFWIVSNYTVTAMNHVASGNHMQHHKEITNSHRYC